MGERRGAEVVLDPLHVGYIPTREACGRGGHEANDRYTYWAKLGPDALDIIVAEAKRLLRELFREAGR